jgi:hypothetical protein
MLSVTDRLYWVSYHTTKAGGCAVLGYTFFISFLTSLVIVPQSSGTLGFPGERTGPLNGDHLQIARYLSRDDDNYIKVAGNIKRLVKKLAPDPRN